MTQPIIASLTQPMFDQFIAPVDDELVSRLVRVDPSLGYAALVEALNASHAPILMTAWQSVPLPESFLADCPGVKVVCHLTGGMRPLIPRALIERGLLVTNWGDAITDTVAEAALLLILSCLRRSVQCQMNLHIRKGWREGITEPDSLLGRKVGLHGLGSVARHLTRFLAPFACQVSAYSPPVPDELFHQYHVRREASLDRLFAENDVIVELAALTPQTVGMVDERLLRLIRPGGVLVNVGRGPVIDGAALARVALEGKIWIGLDVTDPEPLPPDSPLRGLENVFLTPHMAGPTVDRRYRCGIHAFKNIRAFMRGEPLDAVIGLTQYDRMT